MREPGYYWVRFRIITLFTEDDKEDIGDWTVAFWDGQHWDEYGTDNETYIINETRILNPDEVKEEFAELQREIIGIVSADMAARIERLFIATSPFKASPPSSGVHPHLDLQDNPQ